MLGVSVLVRPTHFGWLYPHVYHRPIMLPFSLLLLKNILSLVGYISCMYFMLHVLAMASGQSYVQGQNCHAPKKSVTRSMHFVQGWAAQAAVYSASRKTKCCDVPNCCRRKGSWLPFLGDWDIPILFFVFAAASYFVTFRLPMIYLGHTLSSSYRFTIPISHP